nr:hypothetical protein CFP56_14103 [Quercus suber]
MGGIVRAQVASGVEWRACAEALQAKIPSRGPIIPPYELEYMLAPPGLSGGWDSFGQASRPSQDPRYSLGISGGTGPSTGPFAGDNDDDDDDDTD